MTSRSPSKIARRAWASTAALLLGASLFACAGGRRAGPAPPLCVWLGGDVHLAQGGEVFTEVPAPLRGGAGLVNLEGPVGRPVAPPLLWNHPQALRALRRAGVALVGVANNHDQDLGEGAGAATVAAVAAVGLRPAGGLAGAAVLPGSPRVVVTAHALAGALPDHLGAELQAARRRGDVLVSTFHTQGPASYLPDPVLQRAVDVALAAGALVVAAHGSHLIGPVERRGDAVIAWGLGNLRFRCPCTQESDALLLRVDLPRGARPAAAVIPLRAGLGEEAARLHEAPEQIYELLGALGSAPLRRDGPQAWF